MGIEIVLLIILVGLAMASKGSSSGQSNQPEQQPVQPKPQPVSSYDIQVESAGSVPNVSLIDTGISEYSLLDAESEGYEQTMLYEGIWATNFVDVKMADGTVINPQVDAVVALPFDRYYLGRKVIVRCQDNRRTGIFVFRDRGPWYVNDSEYYAGERPLAELVNSAYVLIPQYDVDKTAWTDRTARMFTYVKPGYPWPSDIARRLSEQTQAVPGAPAGITFAHRIPTQKAGIDLTPAAWRVLGHDGGSRFVDWDWAD